jgi:uncharacterized protein (TIGR02246 family)
MTETDIEAVVGVLESAWSRGDAAAFAQPFRPDGTFTNVNGTTYQGRVAFEERHRAIFAGPLKGSSTTMHVRRLQLVRPDVALVDVDCSTVTAGGQSLESKLLLVLTREQSQWLIAVFHNTPVQASPIVR